MIDVNTVLASALEGRNDEVIGYQINIDNYTLALKHINAMPEAERVELIEFSKELEERLAAEKYQQKRAMVMQAVIKQQLEVLK